jgi:hypothetical protein
MGTRKPIDVNGPAEAGVGMDGITCDKLQEAGDEAMREINMRLQHMLEEAPSDASAKLFIRKVRTGYKGLLKVYSCQRKFVTGAIEGKFTDLIEDLFKDIQLQIQDWKEHRFA